MKFALRIAWMVLVVVVCMSCGSKKAVEEPKTIVLEGHDYYRVYAYGFTYTLEHKGNCRACEDRWQKVASALAK